MTHIATITPADEGGAHLEQSIADLLKIVREQLKLDVMFVAEFVGGNRVFRHICAGKDLGIHPGDFHSREQSLCQRIVDGKLERLVPDVPRLRKLQGLPDFEVPIGLHIGVPVRFADGTLYGTLCGFTFEPSTHLKSRDVKRMEMAADAAARLLAQAEGCDFYGLEGLDISTMPAVLH